MENSSRRKFFKNSIALGSSLAIPYSVTGSSHEAEYVQLSSEKYQQIKSLDLSPARWIWFPSQRCLPNTIILFRKEINLGEKPIRAMGWILGDSRYKLYLNGERIQFGPAPSDPRWSEADPIDLTSQLVPGKNVIGSEVLYYGSGDGTWPIGKPGFIFYLKLEFTSAPHVVIVSDDSWHAAVALAWRPGQYKRWYLRAFQEEFDARRYPYGWNTKSFELTPTWHAAMEIEGAANKPVITARYSDYLYDSQAQPGDSALRARSITMPAETLVSVKQLTESARLRWRTSADEYFSFVTPDAFEVTGTPTLNASGTGAWKLSIHEDEAVALTFEFQEQIVGFPFFTVSAPEGTIIELLVHEAHQPGTDVIINSHFHSWTRFICKEGVNHFETFDYESLRWLQLHIRNTNGAITVSDVGVRRRLFNWQHKPVVQCSDPEIQKVVNASINTLYNCAIETIVDGMGRERQQYSGDVGHVLHAVFLTMGEPTVAARFINTYSQGITSQGYFLDCWPAFDRLARVMEREMQLSQWGPLLDHGVGFNFDCYHYYLYTGEAEAIREAFPSLIRFFNYLLSIKQDDGLLPVENIGVPVVWMDHNAYKQQRHKQCAFNLYASAMMLHALTPLCAVYGESALAGKVSTEGRKLLETTQKKFWSAQDGLFINNLPWLSQDGEKRMCDRSLATALLFDQCPGNNRSSSLKALSTVPDNLGLSYPANANWRYWALSKFGDDTFIKELRNRWSKMDSVNLNNTLAEDWVARPDSSSQWSHCPISPLFGMHMCVAGIKPLKPGFEEIEIAPMMGDLSSLQLDTHSPQGVIHLSLNQKKQKLFATIDLPGNIKGKFVWKGKLIGLRSGRQEIVV